MFNLSIGSMLEWPAMDGLVVRSDSPHVVSVEQWNDVLRATAMQKGIATLSIQVDDGFFLSFVIQVLDDRGR